MADTSPTYSVFDLNLAAAGSLTIQQFVGVLRLIQAVDSAGALVLTPVVNVRVGWQEKATLPMRVGQAIVLQASTQLTLSWAATAGVTAKFLHSPDAAAFDMDADPPAQLVLGELGATITAAAVSVGITATSIVASNANRKSVIIINTGTANVFIGASGVTTAAGLRLQAGEALILDKSTAAIFGIVASGTNEVRYLEEAA